MPLLILLLFGTIEFGRLIWSSAALHFAVEEAARCAAVDANNCGSQSAVQTFAVGRAAGLSLSNSVFTLSTQACGTQVSASYPFQFVIGYFSGYNMTLTAQSCFPK